jgi:DNA-binding transcriptional regulator YhcF (GntR family)
MKISKAKLRQIIKEELGTLREEDPAEETALNSPRQAGREWAIKNLRVAINRAAGAGLSNDEIRKVIEDKIESGTEHGRFTSTGPWAPEYRDK